MEYRYNQEAEYHGLEWLEAAALKSYAGGNDLSDADAAAIKAAILAGTPVTLAVKPGSHAYQTWLAQGRPTDPQGNLGYVTYTYNPDFEAQNQAYTEAVAESERLRSLSQGRWDSNGNWIPGDERQFTPSSMIPKPPGGPVTVNHNSYSQFEPANTSGPFGGILGSILGGIGGFAIGGPLGAAAGAGLGSFGGSAAESAITGSNFKLFPSRGLGPVGEALLAGAGAGIGSTIFGPALSGASGLAPVTAEELAQAGTNLVANGTMTAGDALAAVNAELLSQGLGQATLDAAGNIVVQGAQSGLPGALPGVGSLPSPPLGTLFADSGQVLNDAAPLATQLTGLTPTAAAAGESSFRNFGQALADPFGEAANSIIGQSTGQIGSTTATTGGVASQLMSALGISSPLAQSIIGTLGTAGALALVAQATGGDETTQTMQRNDQTGLAQFPGLNAQAAGTQANAIQNLGSTLTAQNALPTSFDLPGGVNPAQSFSNAITNAQNRVNTPTPFPTLDAMGLFPGQRTGFDEAVKQSSSLFSGNLAARGFLSPENVGAIAGSAAQHTMPQFAPLIGTNLNNQATFNQNVGFQNQGQLLDAAQGGLTASLSPESVRQARNKQLQDYINGITSALGGQATASSTGQTVFPSFGQALGTGAASGLAASLFAPSTAGVR